MNFYLLLITLTIVNAGVVTDTKCDGVIIDGHYHEKEILETGLDRPYSLAVDYKNNIMYFCYKNITWESASFDLNTKEFKDINDVSKGYAKDVAVDQNTHDVYIVRSNGVYKYDHKNHKSEFYAANDLFIRIKGLFIKDILYFLKDSPGPVYHYYSRVYTYIDRNIARFNDMEETTVHEFVIDGDNVMFYSNITGFYAQRKGGKDAVLYSKESVNALTLDVHGNAYMCTENAIYKINKIRMSLDKLIDVNYCRGFAFDGYNNLIYADIETIVRLIKIPKIC